MPYRFCSRRQGCNLQESSRLCNQLFPVQSGAFVTVRRRAFSFLPCIIEFELTVRTPFQRWECLPDASNSLIPERKHAAYCRHQQFELDGLDSLALKSRHRGTCEALRPARPSATNRRSALLGWGARSRIIPARTIVERNRTCGRGLRAIQLHRLVRKSNWP